jgi:hypothetical protein
MTALSVPLQVAQGLFPRHPLLFTYMILQVEDSPSTDLVRYFPKCFEFIDTAISKGGKCRGLMHPPGGEGGKGAWCVRGKGKGGKGRLLCCCV